MPKPPLVIYDNFALPGEARFYDRLFNVNAEDFIEWLVEREDPRKELARYA